MDNIAKKRNVDSTDPFCARTDFFRAKCARSETTTSKQVRTFPAVACQLDKSKRISEFRRHKDVTNKVHVIGFLSQWKVYLDQLPLGPDGAEFFRGKPLDPTTLEKVCDLTITNE